MVQMLKHVIENSKFPIFLLPIHDCRNKTLGNNIHSSQYHRSFCKQILSLKFCRLWCLRGALLRSKLVVCKGRKKPNNPVLVSCLTKGSKADQQIGMKQYKIKTDLCVEWP